LHRTASVNETSTRYSVVQDEFEYFDELRLQAKDNKQGSSGLLETTEYGTLEELIHLANEAIITSFSEYRRLIGAGVAREQARNVLPLATYSELYWKIDLHNLFHFLRLRLDPHAQKEIRDFAEAIASILKEWVPIAYQAFVDYRLSGCYLSKQELEIIRMKLQGLAWDPAVDFINLSKREQSEFLSKL
jgi:thymidylate synthase (FAD)